MKKLQLDNVSPELQAELQKYGLVEYDEPIDLKADERTIKKNMEVERKYDQSLDPIAAKIFALYEKVGSERKPSICWQIGDILIKFEKKNQRENKQSYERKNNFLQRISEKIDDLIAAKGDSEKSPPSLRYLREFMDFRKYRKRSQVDDSISWSIQFEFLDLDDEGWAIFTKLFHTGELKNKEKIREAVRHYKKSKEQDLKKQERTHPQQKARTMLPSGIGSMSIGDLKNLSFVPGSLAALAIEKLRVVGNLDEKRVEIFQELRKTHTFNGLTDGTLKTQLYLASAYLERTSSVQTS